MVEKEKTKPDSSIKTTLDDIIELGSAFYPRGMGKNIIRNISRKLPKKDMRYVFFYFREAICLADMDFFNASIIYMITMVEYCLRYDCCERSGELKLQKEKLKTNPGLGTLRDLRNRLKPLSGNTSKSISELNKLRAIFIHTDAEKGKKRVLTDHKIKCPEFFLGDDSIQKREAIRTLINSRAYRYFLRVFWLSLKIIKELYPDVGNYDNAEFDEMVQNVRNRDLKFY